MGDMHNLQIVVSLAPRQVKAYTGVINGPANGTQIINVVSQEVREKRRSQVQELTESEGTEETKREDKGKRCSGTERKIDLYQ